MEAQYVPVKQPARTRFTVQTVPMGLLKTLAEFMEETTSEVRIPEPFVLNIFVQALTTVERLHGRGERHGDLCPSVRPAASLPSSSPHLTSKQLLLLLFLARPCYCPEKASFKLGRPGNCASKTATTSKPCPFLLDTLAPTPYAPFAQGSGGPSNG